MLEKLKNVQGLNLSRIAKIAKISPHRILFAFNDYKGRRRSALSEEEEAKIISALKKMIKELSKILSHYE